MTNYEKYKNEIDKFTCLGISFGFNKKTKKFDACYNIADCENCMFYKGRSCLDKKMKWAYSEYIEPTVDWAKVPVDTPILVNNSICLDWVRNHFAKYENGRVYAWEGGKTSYTTDKTCYWKYAKLADVQLLAGEQE